MIFFASPYVHLRGRRRYVFALYFLTHFVGLKRFSAELLVHRELELFQLEELAVEGYWVSHHGVEKYCEIHGIERIPSTEEE